MEILYLRCEDERLPPFLDRNSHLQVHTPAYARFIEAAFSCQYLFAAAVDNHELKLILPFVEVKSRIFGNRVISTAYLEYGGFSGDEAYLLDLLAGMKEKSGKDNLYLEIRGGMEQFDAALSSVTIKKNLYKRFVLDLKKTPPSSGGVLGCSNTGPQEIEYSFFNTVKFSSGSVPAVHFFRSNIQDAKRKAINKAKRNNVEVKDVPLEDLDQLYNLYCRNMQRFGSPPYSKNYFENFYKHLANKTTGNNSLGKIYGAYIEGKLAAALLGLCYGDRAHIIIAVSDEKKQDYRPNDAVHSEFIEWAIENRYRFFDFGRVREDSGQFEYKQKWGPTLLDLPSYFVLWQGKEIPEVDPRSAKYELLVSAWKKMPLWLTKKLGHRLRKELGI